MEGAGSEDSNTIWKPYRYNFSNTTVSMPNAGVKKNNDAVSTAESKNIFNKVLATKISNSKKDGRNNRTKKRKMTEDDDRSRTQVNSDNRFEMLSEDENPIEEGNSKPGNGKSNNNYIKDSNKASSVNNTNISEPFCPPIFIKGISVKEIQKNLENLPNNTKIKFVNCHGNRVKLFVNNIDVHKKLITELRDLGAQAYSFAPKSERKATILIKGIDSNFSSEEILEALLVETNREIEILKVAPFSTPRSKKNNRSLNMFIVHLKSSADLDKLIKIRFILYQRVSWEKIKKIGVARCYRCQRFGHGSDYCTSSTICVLYSGKHDFANCPEVAKKKRTRHIPVCANCGQNHTASYKGCTKYVNYMKKKEQFKQKAKEVINVRKQFINRSVNNYVKGNISFADMAKSGSQNIQIANNTRAEKRPIPDNTRDNIFQDFLNEASVLFNRSFSELIQEIRQFWPKYLSLNSKDEKLTAYLQFLTTIVV